MELPNSKLQPRKNASKEVSATSAHYMNYEATSNANKASNNDVPSKFLGYLSIASAY